MRGTWSPMGWMCALLLWGAIGYVNGLPVKTDTGNVFDDAAEFVESAFGDAENVIVPMQPANERPSMKVVSSVFDDIEEGLSIQPANYRPSMEVGSAIIYPHGPPLTGGNLFDNAEEILTSIIGDDKKDLAIQRENYRPSMEVGKSLFDDAAEIANGIVNTNVRPLEFIEPIYEGIAEIANSFSDDGEERLLKLIKFNNSPSE